MLSKEGCLEERKSCGKGQDFWGRLLSHIVIVCQCWTQVLCLFLKSLLSSRSLNFYLFVSKYRMLKTTLYYTCSCSISIEKNEHISLIYTEDFMFNFADHLLVFLIWGRFCHCQGKLWAKTSKYIYVWLTLFWFNPPIFWYRFKKLISQISSGTYMLLTSVCAWKDYAINYFSQKLLLYFFYSINTAVNWFQFWSLVSQGPGNIVLPVPPPPSPAINHDLPVLKSPTVWSQLQGHRLSLALIWKTEMNNTSWINLCWISKQLCSGCINK